MKDSVYRSRVTQSLSKQLADTIDLRSQTRQAHFNVKGANMEELKSLFDGLARDLRQFADLIAERIRMLGGQANATVRFAAAESNLRDYPVDALDAHDHLEALLSSYSRYELDTRYHMKAAQEDKDSETAGLLQAILVSIENNLWFLEACLEGVTIGHQATKLPRWTSAFESFAAVGTESEDAF